MQKNRPCTSQTILPQSNITKQLFHPLRHQYSIWSRSRLIQYCPIYFNITNNYYSSPSSYSLFSSQHTSSSHSFTIDSKKSNMNPFSTSTIPYCNTIIPMICLPIHSHQLLIFLILQLIKINKAYH